MSYCVLFYYRLVILLLREVMQCSFKQYFDYYSSTAKKFLKLDGQPMLVI